MAEPPKLTDAEALAMRILDLDACELSRVIASLYDRDLRDAGSNTPLGRAALAAYDAEQRRAIRVEAMQKCEDVAKEEAREWAFDAESCGPSACYCVAETIRGLIAKEDSNG